MKIKLKKLEYSSGDSERIINQTEGACERLNLFLKDFVESVEILVENSGASSLKADGGLNDELTVKLDFMKSKISEVESAMRDIAESMPELVEIEES